MTSTYKTVCDYVNSACRFHGGIPVELVEAFKNATDDDLVVFGRTIGPSLRFDRVVVAAL